MVRNIIQGSSLRNLHLPMMMGIALLVAVMGMPDTFIAQSLQISEVQRVSESAHPFPVVESYVAVNPTDSNNLLISAMSTSAEQSIMYRSQDGGETWQQVQGPQDGMFPGGDPMLTFDGNGRAYFTTINPGFSVWHSEDNGQTWLGSVTAGDNNRYDDRQWVAASQELSNTTLPVYGAAKTLKTINGREQDVIITTVSYNGGDSFKDPQIMPVDSGYLQIVSDLIVSNEGTLYMPYVVNYERLDDGRYRGKIWIQTSKDEGKSWSTPNLVSEYLSYGDRHGNQRWQGLGITKLAVDESGGKFDGTVYMSWAAPVKDHLQILMARSKDRGRTWSEPVRVNNGGFNSNHSTPMVAINKEGIIAVSWNDRRNDSEDLCFQHFVAVSKDGGQTFSKSQPISTKQTCPGSGRWLNGGETQGLVALPDGSFRVVWSVGERNSLSLWTAVVSIE